MSTSRMVSRAASIMAKAAGNQGVIVARCAAMRVTRSEAGLYQADNLEKKNCNLTILATQAGPESSKA